VRPVQPSICIICGRVMPWPLADSLMTRSAISLCTFLSNSGCLPGVDPSCTLPRRWSDNVTCGIPNFLDASVSCHFYMLSMHYGRLYQYMSDTVPFCKKIKKQYNWRQTLFKNNKTPYFNWIQTICWCHLLRLLVEYFVCISTVTCVEELRDAPEYCVLADNL